MRDHNQTCRVVACAPPKPPNHQTTITTKTTKTNMGNNASRKEQSQDTKRTHQTHQTHQTYRSGKLGVVEQQIMTLLDCKDQVMDKQLDNICANLDALHSDLNAIQHEIQDHTSIVAKVRWCVGTLVRGHVWCVDMFACVDMLVRGYVVANICFTMLRVCLLIGSAPGRPDDVSHSQLDQQRLCPNVKQQTTQTTQ